MSATMFLLIVACALVTWLPRILPFVFVRSITLPTVVMRWLSYIPICILSALVLSNLFHNNGRFVTLHWDLFFAFIPTVIVALWTKSLSITVMVGIIAMACVRYFATAF
ncbi:branched-chain amino acid transporter AzlD [Kurthia sibirica]|uniref:Branched-chain amino acid transporter AzlD n=2 Tax=Kurthia sibirica TaxID=202750 RepID=A0A2U3ANF4_9BACL|nr:AzlD domain-containing protein [Kurthia sibirica]PWI26062.1 branched-chain amino acid transporter AzlD [Kurthia sibirica]